MNIKHMFITILALLPLTSIFHINGMLIPKKSLLKLSQQQTLRYCNQLPQKNTCYPIKDANIVHYDRERDEKIIADIAFKHLPMLISDISPDNKHEKLQDIMTTLNNSSWSTSKVYLLNDKPIGFINYCITQPYIRCHIEPTAHINWLAIDDAHQGKGIGSALLHDTLDECNKHSVAKITLLITDWMLKDYYSKFGFTHTNGSKYTGVEELTKRLQPHPATLLYLAIREWFGKLKK